MTNVGDEDGANDANDNDNDELWNQTKMLTKVRMTKIKW